MKVRKMHASWRKGLPSAGIAHIGLVGLTLAFLASTDAQAQSSPSAYTTGHRYDLVRRETGTISPDPDGSGSIAFAAVRNTYDTAGRLTKVEKGELAAWQSEAVAPASWTGFTVHETVDTDYDGLDRKIKETRSSGGTTFAVTQYSYDSVGRLECTAVRMNPSAFGSLPASACSLGTTGGDGPDRITKNNYDAGGQLTKVIRAYGVTTANGFPVTLQQDYAVYTYSNNGKRKTVTDANGNRAEMFYDGFDRQIAWAFPSKANSSSTAACDISGLSEVNGISGPTENRNASDDCEKYAYDRNGNRAKLMKRDGQVINYSYDALNRMTLKDLPSGSDVYYGYDLRGLQAYARFGSMGSEDITNVWDGLGRLTSSTNNMGGTSRTLSYQYDADGNRTRLTFPDGQYFTFDYDGLDRMTGIRENGGTQIASFSYNNRGERTGIGGGFNTGFSYDGISRLAGITHDMAGTGQDVTFCMGTMSGSTCNPVYNAASQILNRTVSNSAYVWNGHANVNRAYAVNGLNQYTTAGSASFSYDPNGNLTSDGSTTYAYDVENRLLSASGATNATLSYDSTGRLYQTAGSATTRFLYDGDELVGEYDGSGNLLRRYIHGSGNDDPLVWYEGSGLGDRRHLRADHQGSIVAISNSAGNSIGLNSYDEYGIPGTGNIGRFAYTGQIRIPELGMYHYKARIYSPTLGRFLQTDPIGYDDQINLYAYVQNDPLNRVDPTGNSWEDVADIVVGGAKMAVGTVGAIAGGVIVGGSGVAEVGTAGVATPVAVPAAVGGATLVVASGVVATDGASQAGRGLQGLVSEARRSGPGPYRCTNPTCDAPHGGVTGTTECPDCDGKRRRGSPLPGPTPRPLPPVKPSAESRSGSAPNSRPEAPKPRKKDQE